MVRELSERLYMESNTATSIDTFEDRMFPRLTPVTASLRTICARAV